MLEDYFKNVLKRTFLHVSDNSKGMMYWASEKMCLGGYGTDPCWGRPSVDSYWDVLFHRLISITSYCWPSCHYGWRSGRAGAGEPYGARRPSGLSFISSTRTGLQVSTCWPYQASCWSYLFILGSGVFFWIKLDPIHGWLPEAGPFFRRP